MTTPTPTLSAKDTHILSLLSLPSSSPLTTYPTLTTTTTITSPVPPTPTPSSKESTILIPLNTPSPTTPIIRNAITQLTTLITEHPSYASAYNNRAQASRMLYGDDLRDGEVYEAGIWSDLGMAIEIAEGEGGVAVREGGGVDEGVKRVLAAAYTQRAWMVYKLSKAQSPTPPSLSQTTTATETTNNRPSPLPTELRHLDTAALESWAAHDFVMGAKYGNVAAAEMAKATNPYARLCGAIVGEVMRREMGCGGVEGGD